jgi:hypothetical protein
VLAVPPVTAEECCGGESLIGVWGYEGGAEVVVVLAVGGEL